MFSIFVVMEFHLLTWKERLDQLQLHDTIQLDEEQSDQSIYTAIRDNAELFKKRQFSIRRDKTTKTNTYPGKRFIMRIK